MTTIPFNLLFSLLLGACFTACARTQLLSGAQPLRRAELDRVLSFAVLTVAPVATYFYLAYPAWSWMYLVDPDRIARGTGLAVVVLTMLMVPLGYLLGWLVLLLLGETGLFALLGVLTTAAALLVALARRRLFHLCRFDDFRIGGMLLRPLTQSKLFFALLCTTPAVLAAAILVGWSLWGQGRWLRQQAASASLRSTENQIANQAVNPAAQTSRREPTPSPRSSS